MTEELQARSRTKVIALEQKAEPIVGWRVWRVFAINELNGGGATGYRLSSIGTKCAEKFWKPRAAKEAVCSDFATAHEAPWPDRECGVWALRTREQAEAVVAHYAPLNGAEAVVAWAFGRVTLWGRVVECEKGWRGQFAYPYDLAAHSDDVALERALRELYLVDVTLAPPLAFDPQEEEQEQAEEDEEEDEELEEPHPTKPGFKYRDELGALSDEDVLAGFVASLARANSNGAGGATTHDFAVIDAVYALHGHDGRGLPHPDVCRAVHESMERLRAAGFIDSGRVRAYDHSPVWRLTQAGSEHARKTLGPNRRLAIRTGWGEVRELTVTKALKAIAQAPVLFADEIANEREATTPRRLEAKRKGRRHYRDWLEQQRQTVRGRLGLDYSDNEVIAAVREASQLTRRRGRGEVVP